MTSCTLCNLAIDVEPVTAPGTDGQFCCRGCMEVHRRFGSAGEPRRGTEEVEPSVDPPPAESETAYFEVAGMHCGTCGRFLEQVAGAIDGVYGASASYATEMLRVQYNGDAVDASVLPEALSGYGYRVGSPEAGDDEGAESVWFDRHRTVLAVLLMMPVLALYVLFVYPVYLGIYPRSFLYGPNVTAMVFVVLTVWSSLAVLAIGYPFFRGAYVSLRVGQPNMDLLVSIAVLAAHGYSVISFVVLGARTVYFDVAVMILAVVTVGNHVEKTVKGRVVTARSLLFDGHQRAARLLQADGSTERVDVDAVTGGERLLVGAGERVPVDGTVLEGTAAVDEALVTGESVPVGKEPGDEVMGGSTVTDARLVVRAGPDGTSTFDRLRERSWDVQSRRSGIQRTVDRFAVLFVPLVVGLAAVTTVGWAAAGASIGDSLLVGVAVLVVSCPCSLGIATPLAVASGSRAAAEAGVLLLDASILDRGPDASVVVFDKTGTLTTGAMTVTDVVADEPVSVLERAAAVEREATHPIGTAIRDAVQTEPPTATDVEERPRCVTGTVDGASVRVGHVETFAPEDWTVPTSVEEAVDGAYEDGEIPTLVGWDGQVRGAIRVRDDPRAEWREALSALVADGRRLVVLTGDDERMARPFADHPSIEDVYAGVRPGAKERIVRRLREEESVAMVGDGTNDAAALAAADVGIALARGTDVTIDAAEAVVTADDLRAIPELFEITAATRGRVRQNLGWAVAYNAIAIPLAVLGLVNPLIAALLMATSSVVVLLNSRRPL